MYDKENEEDKIERQIIESHLKRELRALGDVQIVDKDNDWKFRISVRVLGHETKERRIMTSVSIAHSIHGRVHKSNFKTYDYDGDRIPVLDFGLILSVWSRDNLPAWCVTVVDGFNEEWLKLMRKNG